jgi:hypothetical protein
MNARYYWTQDMQDVRWKTIDYDGTLIEWFDSSSPPMANMVTLRWEGDSINRAMSQKFAVLDHNGNNIWDTTLEENPYFKKTIKNPDIPLEGPWMNSATFEKVSPEYKSPFNALSKNTEINRLRDRVQKLEELLDSSIQHNIELIRLLHSRGHSDEMDNQGLNKDWWNQYKTAEEQTPSAESSYSKKLRAIRNLEMEKARHRYDKKS